MGLGCCPVLTWHACMFLLYSWPEYESSITAKKDLGQGENGQVWYSRGLYLFICLKNILLISHVKTCVVLMCYRWEIWMCGSTWVSGNNKQSTTMLNHYTCSIAVRQRDAVDVVQVTHACMVLSPRQYADPFIPFIVQALSGLENVQKTMERLILPTCCLFKLLKMMIRLCFPFRVDELDNWLL